MRQAAALGAGFFLGCTPLYGLHLPLAILVGWLFGLNRIKIYVAANISNPLFAPFLLFLEVQVGALVRRGGFYSFSMDSFRTLNPWAFAQDLLLGSIIVGVVAGVLGGVITYLLVRRTGLAPAEGRLIEATAQKYLDSGMMVWEFANGKLQYDPVYREILKKGMLPETGTFLDLGCGQGLLLAMLAVAPKLYTDQKWPGDWPPPPSLHLHGVEKRRSRARIARSALNGGAVIEVNDLREANLPDCQAAALVDVLHYLGREEQDVLLNRLVGVLGPAGVLLIREVDADGGMKFKAVQVAERIRSLARGNFRQKFHYRSTRAWIHRLEELGFKTTIVQTVEGTPHAKVLVHARKGDPGRTEVRKEP